MTNKEEKETIFSRCAAKLLYDVLFDCDKYRVDTDFPCISGYRSLLAYANGELFDFRLSFRSDELGSDFIEFDKCMTSSISEDGFLTLTNDIGETIKLRIWKCFSIHMMPEFDVFNISC